MDEIPLLVFIGLLLADMFGEYAAMAYTGTLWRKHKREWTYYAVALPFKATLAGSVVEHVFSHTRPSLPQLISGTLLAAAGIVIRLCGHLQLDGAFSQYVERQPDHRLIATGMYTKIRHPMYVGSILLFLGMPMILGVTWAWVFPVIGIVGILIRIRNEEAFLAMELDGYREYMRNTWRLLPYVY